MNAEKKILHLLIEKEAVIYRGEFADLFAAYPRGDRRRRPVCWLNEAQFRNLLTQGIIEARAGGYHLAYSFLRRHKAKIQGKAHAAQHRDYIERDIYIPGGSKRKAVFNANASPLRRLARLKDKAGEPILSAAEIEAGERFASDYNFCHLGQISTQNYMQAAGASGQKSATTMSRAEDISISRLDAKKRVMQILNDLGGLDRAVIGVCVNELSLDNLERTENWARTSGRMILKLGLQRLVKYYGTEIRQS